MQPDVFAREGGWPAVISIACIVALPLFLLALVAWGVNFRSDLVISGALLVCGWVPLVVLLFAAGYGRSAASLTFLGDLWSFLMSYPIGFAAEPGSRNTASLLGELAEYLIVGGSVGALAGTVFAMWRWRTSSRRWLIAGIAAAAMAGISCSPTLIAAGLRVSLGR